MNSFETFLNDVILFIKKFFTTFYALMFKPGEIIASTGDNKPHHFVNHTIFFFISQLICFAVLKSLADDGVISFIPLAFSSLSNDSSVVICMLLIPCYFILLITTLGLNAIFKTTQNEQQLFVRSSFYYAAVGMIISTIIVSIRSYVLPHFDPYYMIDAFVNSVDWGGVNYYVQKIESDVYQLKPSNAVEQFRNYNLVGNVFTAIDNIICLLVPAIFLVRYRKIVGKFSLKYLMLLLFCLGAYQVNDFFIRFYYPQIYSGSANAGLASVKSNHSGYFSRKVNIKLSEANKVGQRKLTLNFYFNNKTKNKIYLKNDIDVMLLLKRNGPENDKDSLREVRYEGFKLDSANKSDIIGCDAQSVSNFQPYDIAKSFDSYNLENCCDRLYNGKKDNIYACLIKVTVIDLFSEEREIITIFFNPNVAPQKL
ncbi:hypothetical protein KXD93_09175 [Mucilaginibacter sp. BJC16-A38]|uniref:hypothetical protein n=1 Tax=Mucilaginibacter phenanthrenivorans TaxID=1234842 RepID=UPI0021584763|nr:hypothetical protein [Mucilaginibacter phenanthrenivorans]MCR8557812.1 hypothetical protein [Mucilaginibacter phenanthrenivorans]